MLFLSRFRSYFWNIDPGYFNLKQAFKTVLGIVISLLLLKEQSLLTKLMAAIACGFSMQGVSGKTWIAKLKHVFVFDAIYFIVFLLGLSVRDSSVLTAALLVAMGFFSNYIRRFNLENSYAPLMIWVLCFLATILPMNSASEAFSHLSALLIGFGVSAAVSLFIFPENYSNLFVRNSNRFFYTLSQGFTEIRRFLLGLKPKRRASLAGIKKELTKLMDINQTIQYTLAVEDEPRLNELLAHQYGLLNAYILMLEAYQLLSKCPAPLSLSMRLKLIHANKNFAHIMASTRMSKDWQAGISAKFHGLDTQFKHFKVTNEEPDMIMALLNLKFGFEMAKKHLRHLSQGESHV